MTKQEFGKLSLEAQVLFDELIKAEVGHVVTYGTLDDVVGGDVRKKFHGALATARRKALREKRMVFSAIANLGLQRMTDVEIVDGAKADVRRIRRTAHRAAAKLTAVDFASLPNDKKVEHNAQLSVLGVIDQFSSKSALKITESRVREASEVISVGKMLDAFK